MPRHRVPSLSRSFPRLFQAKSVKVQTESHTTSRDSLERSCQLCTSKRPHTRERSRRHQVSYRRTASNKLVSRPIFEDNPGKPAQARIFRYSRFSYGVNEVLCSSSQPVPIPSSRPRAADNITGMADWKWADEQWPPTNFTLDALPVATVPISPGWNQHQSILVTYPGGLVK